MEESISNKIKKQLKIYLLMPFIMVIFLFLFTCSSVGAICGIKLKVIVILYLFFTIVNAILFNIFKNLKTSCIIQSIFIVLICLANGIKFRYTSEPITFSDIYHIGNLSEIIGLTVGSFFHSIMFTIIELFGISIILFLWNYYICKTNIKNEMKKWQRGLISIVSIVLLINIFYPNESNREFMLTKVYDRDTQEDYDRNIRNVEYYAQETILGGMYAESLESMLYPPNNYDIEEVHEVLSKDYNNASRDWEKSNIIVIFSEAFFDVSLLSENITFDKEVTSNFNNLKEEGIFVNMISPAYGGLSSNVEFEFLTGFSMNYFSSGYLPFMQLYKTPEISSKLSLVSELKNNGYYTKVVFGKDYYDSENAYYNIGIDEYMEMDDDPEAILDKHSRDSYLIDKLIEYLDNKDKEQKVFYMTCTIESHMPYDIVKYTDFDVNIVESDLDDNLNNIIHTYAQSCYNADKQLGRLYEYIKNYDEPTIILFFGDHLPYLSDHNTNQDAMNYLKYFNTDSDLINTYRKYNTQTLILANYELGDNMGFEYLSPDMLLTSVLNNMKEIDLSTYYKWLYSIKDNVVPSMNSSVSQDSNGNIIWTKSIQGTVKELYELRENVQYKLLIDE